MLIEVTDENYTGTYYSYTWEANVLTVKHLFNGYVFCQIYDENNQYAVLQVKYIDDDTIQITFNEQYLPTQQKPYSVIINKGNSNFGIEQNGDETWSFEYYAGTVNDVLLFCKSLNIGNGKLCKITNEMVEKYMKLVNGHIDSYLQQYYFVPVRRYNRVNPDGTLEKVFPGKIRLTALQWTAGLLLQSQFQNLQPNQTEAVSKYIQEARKQIYQLTIYNARIPGLRWKANGISHFAPPELMPSKNPQRMQ